MRLRRDPSLLQTLIILLPSLTSANSVTCDQARIDGKSFDFSALDGPHSVNWRRDQPRSIVNTTFTIDICKPLRRTKGVPKGDECRSGTQVCGIERTYYTADDTSVISGVIPIAGNYPTESGRSLDPSWTRLDSSGEDGDAERDGVRLVMHGGFYPFDDRKKGRKQKAVIEFVCAPDRTGLEGEEEGDVDLARRREKEDGEDEDGDGDGDKDERRSLRFVGYDKSDVVDVYRFEWLTKHACENAKEGGGGERDRSRRWGFFTWFIIILFLATATYLIFGSWLNYNRYGARGWDLLPHGDTIRDIPYLLKDWMRRVVNTVQGGGSRGGYSAV